MKLKKIKDQNLIPLFVFRCRNKDIKFCCVVEETETKKIIWHGWIVAHFLMLLIKLSRKSIELKNVNINFLSINATLWSSSSYPPVSFFEETDNSKFKCKYRRVQNFVSIFQDNNIQVLINYTSFSSSKNQFVRSWCTLRSSLSWLYVVFRGIDIPKRRIKIHTIFSLSKDYIITL